MMTPTADSSAAPPWARIVIVAYRSGAHLQNCIDALAAQTDPDFEVVIVDNHCPDNSVADLRLPDARFMTMRASGNIGFAGGSNFGATSARAPWIVTLNPDTIAEPEWLAEMKAAAARQPTFEMLSATLIQADDPSTVDGFGDVLSIYGIAWRGAHGRPVSALPDGDAEVFGPSGACAAFARAAFESTGGFDEWFFCYLEDVDLACRLRRYGCKCLQVRRAIVRHVGSGSTERNGEFQFYQTYRNNLRLILRNAPVILAPLALVLYFSAQAYILYRNRRSPGANARILGLKEALAGIPSALRSRRAIITRLGPATGKILGLLAWKRRSLKNLEAKYWTLSQ